MKLCWWTYYPTVNQTALVRALGARGVDVAVCYFTRYDSYRRELGWRERDLEPWEHFAPTLAAARKAVPDFDERLQMVPGYSKGIAWRLIFSCQRKRIPWFIVTEGTRGRWFMRPLVKAFAWWANKGALRMFCHGERALAQYRAFGVAPDKLCWLGYALEAKLFERSVRGEKDPAGCTFVYVGALSERKAVDVLAAAWRTVQAAHPAARLRVVGEGPLKSVFGGLSGVELRGAVAPEAIVEALQGGDVIVLPSRYDAWGVALTEGAAQGLALIASDRTGAAELIEEGVNGARVPAGDAAALARAMNAYAADPARARSHGEAAHRAALRLKAETLAARLEAELARALEQRAEKIAAAFWEEHCMECAEPACYATCAHFEAGRGGRCRRVDSERGAFFDETVTGCATARLRTWGKIELFFHGRLVSWARARGLERAARRWAWLRRVWARGFRSLRWRAALWGAARGAPNEWRIRCVAARDERLVASLVDRNLNERARWPLALEAGEEKDFRFPLPTVAEGDLFRIFAPDGEPTGEIRFRELAVVAPPPPPAAAEAPAPFVKCLAWDLDGTLWDGTLEEDGEAALRLKTEAVALVKALDARGIVNSIVSRNEPEKALAALKRFGLEEYFVFPQISWGPKSAGVKNLAREMNVALGAIAFVDDREEQRGEVRSNAPGVRVFAAEDVSALAGEACFNPSVSAESALRRIRYREEMARRGAAAVFAGDQAAFLAQSELTLDLFDLATATPDEEARSLELAQRCNQLHLNGRRLTAEELKARVAKGRGWGIRCHDKYGDYGIVGFMIFQHVEATWRLIDFVMSCRVAKKGCERRALDEAKALLNAKEIAIDYRDTGRNAVLREALFN